VDFVDVLNKALLLYTDSRRHFFYFVPIFNFSLPSFLPFQSLPFYIFVMESAMRMITIQVELDSRRLEGSAMLIPYVESILASTTCRQMLQGVLTDHLQQPDLLATVEKVIMFIIKQQDNVSGYGRKTRVDKDIANATACMDLSAMPVIESYSTQYFFLQVDFLAERNTSSKVSCECLRCHEARADIIHLFSFATRIFPYVCQPQRIQCITGVSRGAPTRMDKGHCQ
jgi:hypothetical protein